MSQLPPAVAVPAVAVLAAIPTGVGELLLNDRFAGMLVGLGIALTGLVVEITRRLRAQTALLEAQAQLTKRQAEAQAGDDEAA